MFDHCNSPRGEALKVQTKEKPENSLENREGVREIVLARGPLNLKTGSATDSEN